MCEHDWDCNMLYEAYNDPAVKAAMEEHELYHNCDWNDDGMVDDQERFYCMYGTLDYLCNLSDVEYCDYESAN